MSGAGSCIKLCLTNVATVINTLKGFGASNLRRRAAKWRCGLLAVGAIGRSRHYRTRDHIAAGLESRRRGRALLAARRVNR